MNPLLLSGNELTIDDVYRVAFLHQPAALSEEAKTRMAASRACVDGWVQENRVMYGVTTGFGEFSNVSISASELEDLQRNLILSHAVGCGDPIPQPVVRALMLLRVNAVAKGYSGIRISTAQLLLDMLNNNIVPVIPSQGSVGSSGDLAQLAHLVIGMIGEGECWGENGEKISSASALAAKGLTPVTLTAKEGLALINGTQMMTAYLSITLHRAHAAMKLFDISGTMSLEALLGTDRACSPLLHQVRPHPGQQTVARNVLRLIEQSEIRESHRINHDVVQDAYSLRCMPQVHGASRDAINYVTNAVTTEINSATDNPLIFAETGELIEGGNFHGQPMALVADFLGIALSELANISERRIERMVNGKLSGLPRFLTPKGGLHSGLMIAQYTAAALVSENKVLAHPASVDSIPTSANQEDHNSMGSIGARKAYSILQNIEHVLAIEFLTASQAAEFHAPKHLGNGTAAAFETIRTVVPFIDKDRYLHRDIMAVTELIRNGKILEAVENRIGSLE